jgi:acetyl-CoA acetyltransferase
MNGPPGERVSVYMAGAAMTRVGREESLPDLMAEAGRGALAAAGLERPDALVVAAINPEEFVGEGNFASQVGCAFYLLRLPRQR